MSPNNRRRSQLVSGTVAMTPPPEPSPRIAESRVMKYKCTFSPTVADVFKRRGWATVEEEDADDWDIYFCDMAQMRELFTPSPGKILHDHQRVGHFRNNYEISRKNFMVQNLKCLKARIEKSFGYEESQTCAFFPTTFILPMEEKWFLLEFQFRPACFWIIKPAAGAQGRGIFIFRSIGDFYDWRARLEVKPTTPPPTAVGIPQDVATSLSQTTYLMARLQVSLDNIKKEEMATAAEVTASGEPPSDPDIADHDHDPEVKQGHEGPPDNSAKVKDPQNTSGHKSDIYVIQQYIANPYLIEGKKFDIRFFVLVTSFLPLRAWLYREGFARFCQGQFSLESLQDVYVHLTNVAIQRTAENYDPEMGTKWSIGKLRQYLTTRHGNVAVQELMNKIDNIVVRTLQSVHQLIIPDRHCFEIYGFDVLIDDALAPWLLEVNCSPSFTPSNDEDYKLKSALIDDTIHILDLEKRLTGYEKRVGGFDLIWDDGPVYAVPGDSRHFDGFSDGHKLNSFLGCDNDRAEQINRIMCNALFVREMQKMKSTPNGVTVLRPATRYSAPPPSAQQPIRDERFRMPSTNHNPSGRALEKKHSTKLHTSLVVYGKSLQLKRNLAAPIRRY